MADSVVIRRLVAELGIEVDDAGIARFEASLDSLKEEMLGLVDIAANVAKGLALVGAGVVAATIHVSNLAFQADALAEAFGMSTDEFQASAAALQRSGLEIDDIADLYGTIADRAQDAIDGTQSFVDDFKLLGIAVDDLRGKNPQEVFELIIEKVDSSADTTAQLAGIARTFGDDLGRKVLPVLNGTVEEFRALRAEAIALGLAINESGLKRLKAMRTSLQRLMGSFQGLINILAVQVAPYLEQIGDIISNYLLENVDEITQQVKSFGDRIGGAAIGILNFGQRLSEIVSSPGFRTFIGYLEAAVVALGSLVLASKGLTIFTTISSLISAAGVSVGAFAGATIAGIGAAIAPVVLLAAAIAAVALAVEDLYSYWRGGESVFGTLLSDYKEAEGLLGAISRALNAVIDSSVLLATLFKNTVIPLWAGFKQGIIDSWESLGIISDALEDFYYLWTLFYDNVIAPVVALLNPLKALEIGLNNLAKGLNFFVNNSTNRELAAAGKSPFVNSDRFPPIPTAPIPTPSPSSSPTTITNTVNFGGVAVNASGMDPQTASQATQNALQGAINQAAQNYRTGAR